MDKVANKTGEAIEKSVEITEKVVNEAKPVAKSVVVLGKKGLKAMKKATLDVADDLKKK